ncbi:alpha-ketoglutarate-dependent dioxygenase alkB homolog 6 isoform X1 [Hypanus sabinus]|uniref:alpha-ketoglutarate-dependent dioxygenase alkB homolog 6 isoform X1 n=1 Tax=Hypanus sabinus TaxID=79690 RepID=UPI0028C3D25F|nr:alpha-ketoglutarate-dependent dioxygenase alkB homolog 6 isoform X1 [Hypanus sabinus]
MVLVIWSSSVWFRLHQLSITFPTLSPWLKKNIYCSRFMIHPNPSGLSCREEGYRTGVREHPSNRGGLPHPKGMLIEKLPDWLEKYTKRISSMQLFTGKVANHVLVNEYNPGEGIMPHEDGPLYFPTVTTISLGSQTLLDFYHPITKENEEIAVPQTEENRYFLSLLVEPRSLLVLKDSMYLKYLHGIRPVSEDVITDKVANLTSCNSKLGAVLARTTRVSLTVRHVPKVLKTSILLGKKK